MNKYKLTAVPLLVLYAITRTLTIEGFESSAATLAILYSIVLVFTAMRILAIEALKNGDKYEQTVVHGAAVIFGKMCALFMVIALVFTVWGVCLYGVPSSAEWLAIFLW